MIALFIAYTLGGIHERAANEKGRLIDKCVSARFQGLKQLESAAMTILGWHATSSKNPSSDVSSINLEEFHQWSSRRGKELYVVLKRTCEDEVDAGVKEFVYAQPVEKYMKNWMIKDLESKWNKYVQERIQKRPVEPRK